mmetsp:Transcript_31807/g.83032  ORF Transcript_31807/g.83032 Transcript_31807/m.83032 type:complete len:202 (-) Transcript_31807:1635-2240(-)
MLVSFHVAVIIEHRPLLCYYFRHLRLHFLLLLFTSKLVLEVLPCTKQSDSLCFLLSFHQHSVRAVKHSSSSAVVLRCYLCLRVAHPYLDMLRLLQQPLIELPYILPLFLLQLHVDVRLPHGLRHVKSGLSHSKLEEGPRPLDFTQRYLQVCELVPSMRVFRRELNVFLMEGAASVDVSDLHLHCDVLSKQLVLWAQANGSA